MSSLQSAPPCLATSLATSANRGPSVVPMMQRRKLKLKQKVEMSSSYFSFKR